MIEGYPPVVQALLGTLFTWGLTALGAAFAVVARGGNRVFQRKLLDGSLGFAGGVMTAASYWSLLAPAIEMAQKFGILRSKWRIRFHPGCRGIFLGRSFRLRRRCFHVLPRCGISDRYNDGDGQTGGFAPSPKSRHPYPDLRGRGGPFSLRFSVHFQRIRRLVDSPATETQIYLMR